MLRVVLDTNVIVSAVISKGKPRELLNRGIGNRFSIVTSDYILKEVVSVLGRPQFKTSEEETNMIVLALMQSSEVAIVESKFKVIKNDPDDDMILNTAHDGRADIIATGDKESARPDEF
ncbi:MAG TPA: putative toxin-antitoxin system toxin component, PIN family [Nitrososphaerales archaeon]|nr:putative toxin-antitoxin system toxin component, PIN family [Nitrososphaerales archaeon]